MDETLAEVPTQPTASVAPPVELEVHGGLSRFHERRVIFLDALGTIVQLEPPARRLALELKRRFGMSVSDAKAQRAIGAEIAYYRAHLDEGQDESSVADLRRRCAEVLWRELAVSHWQPEIEALVGTLMASLVFRPFDDVPGELARLKKEGFELVVVSNWDASLPEVLDRLGLGGHLDAVVTSASVGARKPDRAIFERALQVAGARASEAIHVGDSLKEDVEGARAAGIEAVLLVRSGRQRGLTDAGQISSLQELSILLGVGTQEC